MADGDDDTDCTLCYEAFSDSDEGRIPRNLSCGHTYCTECMRNLRDNIDGGSDSDDNMGFKLIDGNHSRIRCPQCKKTSEIRNGDVSNLAKNYALINLMEKMRNLQVKAEGSRKYKCPEHSDEDLRYWCSNAVCQKPVCSHCLLEGQHQDHKFCPLSHISGSKRQTLREKLLHAEMITAETEEAFQSVSLEIQNLCSLGESAKQKMKAKFEGMRNSLEEREKELLGKIDSYIEDTQETLEIQKQMLEDHLQRAREVSKEARQTAEGHDLEVLSKFKQSTEQMWKLEDESQGVVMEPLVRPVIRFRGEVRDIMQQIVQFGELCFEEQRPQKQVLRTVEQQVSGAKSREGSQSGALARRPLQRRAEKELPMERPSLDPQFVIPPTVRDPHWVEEVDHGVVESKVELRPSPSPSHRHQPAHPSAPSIRSDDETRQIFGVRMRSRAPTEMSLLHTVNTSPPLPPRVAKAAPSHSPTEGMSWKERVSYVNQLEDDECDFPPHVGHPTDSYRHGPRANALIPAALPPVARSTRDRSPNELCTKVPDDTSQGVVMEGSDSVVPPERIDHEEDIWSAAMRPL